MDKSLLEIFLDLIVIDGISGKERDIANYIIAFLEKIGLSPYEDKCAKLAQGNAGNVICHIGTGENIVIVSHMDTARSTKGVNPRILNDRITSDGSTVLGVDNRAGIACLLYSIQKLKTENIPLKDFTLAFTIQEETTLNGSTYLELDHDIKSGYVFDSHLKPGNIVCESAGSIGFKICIHGKASHSGLAPEQGIDSIKIASNAISRIQLGRIDPDTTANIGIIKGGSATNVVPELTVLEGEVRSMLLHKIDNKIEEIKNKFDTAAKELGGISEFNSDWNFKQYKVGPETETYKTIERVLLNAGLFPIQNISKGGSDANSLNAKGISCVNLGIGAQNPHSNDEFILIEDLKITAIIAMELMKK